MKEKQAVLLAIVSTSRQWLDNLQEYIKLTDGEILFDTYSSTRELLTALSAGVIYQAVVVNTFLPDMTPEQFLKKIGGMSADERPLVLFVMDMPDSQQAQRLRMLGADQVLPKLMSMEDMLNSVIAAVLDPQEYLRVYRREAIWQLLREYGIPPMDVGYEYLFIAVDGALESGPGYMTTKELYPNIARRYDVSWTAVDSGIRRLAERYFPKDSPAYEDLCRLAGLQPGQNLSNARLICALACEVIRRMGWRSWIRSTELHREEAAVL